jgi:uncharacterized protein
MGVLDRDYIQQRTETRAVGSFANKVYGWMTVGLLTTAAVAFGIIQSGLYVALLPYYLIPVLGTLVLAFAIQGALSRASFGTMALMFLLYSGLQGVIFGTVLPLYAMSVGGEVIWSAFLTAGLLFGSSVLYGIFSKSDLTSMGRIFRVALFGLIGLTVLNMILSFFMHIPTLNLLISYIGLVIFIGLTAYDAQAIRRVSAQVDGNGAIAAKMSLMMALKMYLNVIMIFWFLLQIFAGGRRR